MVILFSFKIKETDFGERYGVNQGLNPSFISSKRRLGGGGGSKGGSGVNDVKGKDVGGLSGTVSGCTGGSW